MKTTIRVESFEQTSARGLERARKLTRGEVIEPEKSISFETVEDMLTFITAERVRLCQMARRQAHSITELAAALERPRSAVARDVKALAEIGLLHVSRRTNPGHGQVSVVEPVAERFTLSAEF